MKTATLLTAATLAVAITTGPAIAQTAAPSASQPDRAQVERVQKALKDAGHDPGAIDGVMGARTSAALKAYQTKEGLSASGQLDDATMAKIGGGQAAQASPSSNREQTGGDTKPSAVDPAQAKKTGANAGEGASYSRSTEKGQSTMKDTEEKRK
jgi:peptidoglycan hydrolase-like protein with peptidoglycan-binding domain